MMLLRHLDVYVEHPSVMDRSEGANRLRFEYFKHIVQSSFPLLTRVPKSSSPLSLHPFTHIARRMLRLS